MLQLFAPRETDSTSDVLGHDWSEVASELSGHSKHQYKERYRLADTVAELKFVFIRVIFLRSPSSRSSLVLTKVTDSADSARPIHYSTPVAKLTYLSVYDSRDGASEHTASPSPPSFLTHVHRYPSPLLLAHACTQVYLFSQPYLTDIAQLLETDVSKCV